MPQDYQIGDLAHNAFDINANGDQLFIAVINSGSVPQILRMAADMASDADVVFNPGSGSMINLMAGDINAYWIWAVGDFGTAKVILSTDGGSYWYEQNEAGWTGGARPILVGPGNDALLTTSIGTTLWQNRYDGDYIYWIERYIPGEIWSVDRIDVDAEETVIGAYWYTDGLVYYSPNSGFNWETVTKNLPTATITSVIAIR